MLDQGDRWFFYILGGVICLVFLMIVMIRVGHTQCVSEAMKQYRTADEIIKICR